MGRCGWRWCLLIAWMALLIIEMGWSADTQMHVAVRAFELSDIDGTYSSEFQFRDDCPDTVSIQNTVLDPRGLAITALEDILVDGEKCAGGNMSSVTKETAQDPRELMRLGLDQFQQALVESEGAKTVFDGVTQNRIVVGYDGGVQRKCGKNTLYSKSTFYFFIREEATFTILIGTEVENTTTVIPSDKKGLFIVEDGSEGQLPRLCILLAPLPDPDSGQGGEDPTDSGMKGPGNGDGKDSNATVEPEPSSEPSVEVDDRPQLSPMEEADDASPDTVDSQNSGDQDSGDQNPDNRVSGDEDSVCFPAFALVELEGGRLVRMEHLRIGDRVRTSAGTWSDVFMFSHRLYDVEYKFVRLQTAAGAAVTLTPSHYIYVAVNNGVKMVEARNIHVGDLVTLGQTGEATRVVAKSMVESRGLYNPQTLDGSIVVDGVRVSTYTRAVHPWLAQHVLLAPVRWLYNLGALKKPFEGVFDRGGHVLAALVPGGPKEIL